MAEWQQNGDGRIGNTAEPFDVPVGHFFHGPKGRVILGLQRRRCSLMGFCPNRSSVLAGDQKSQTRGHGLTGKEA